MLMKKATWNTLLDERTDKIQEIAEKVDYNKLTYSFKDPHIAPINFIKHKGPFHFFKETRDGDKKK